MAPLPNKVLDTVAVLLAASVVVSERLIWPIILFSIKSLERLLERQPSKQPLPEFQVEEKSLEPILLHDTNMAPDDQDKSISI